MTQAPTPRHYLQIDRSHHRELDSVFFVVSKVRMNYSGGGLMIALPIFEFDVKS